MKCTLASILVNTILIITFSLIDHSNGDIESDFESISSQSHQSSNLHQHTPYPRVTKDSSSPTGKVMSETIATSPDILGTCNNTCNGVKGCIHPDYFCDSIQDCPGNEDEILCTVTSCQFRCYNNLNCVPYQSVCDGVKDCPDESDEAGCYVQPNGCLSNQHKCVNSSLCIRRAFICDDVSDCDMDDSDEKNCPEAHFLKNGPQPLKDPNVRPSTSLKPTVPSSTSSDDLNEHDDNEPAESNENSKSTLLPNKNGVKSTQKPTTTIKLTTKLTKPPSTTNDLTEVDDEYESDSTDIDEVTTSSPTIWSTVISVLGFNSTSTSSSTNLQSTLTLSFFLLILPIVLHLITL